jgi:hypothetical protein
MTALVIIEPGPLSKVVAVVIEPPSTMMAATLLETTAVLGWGTSDRGCSRGRIALIRRRRVWTRPLGRSVRQLGVPTAHWSIGVPRGGAVKTHPDRRSHWLRFGRVMMSSTATATSVLLLMGLVRGRMRGRGSWSAPLLRRTTWRLLGSIWLAVRLWWRGSVSLVLWLLLRWWLLVAVGLVLLLLMIKVLGVVGMVVLRRQGMRTGGVMLMSLIGPLLRWLLRSLGVSARNWLRVLRRVLSWMLTRVLGTIRLWLMLRLLRVVSVLAGSMVLGPATCRRLVIASAPSS